MEGFSFFGVCVCCNALHSLHWTTYTGFVVSPLNWEPGPCHKRPAVMYGTNALRRYTFKKIRRECLSKAEEPVKLGVYKKKKDKMECSGHKVARVNYFLVTVLSCFRFSGTTSCRGNREAIFSSTGRASSVICWEKWRRRRWCHSSPFPWTTTIQKLWGVELPKARSSICV